MWSLFGHAQLRVPGASPALPLPDPCSYYCSIYINV